MSVYVDDAMLPYGRMLMSHMSADTTDELLAMADRIGVPRKWIQRAGTYKEHFDVCAAKRKLALDAGAVAVTSRELVARNMAKLKVNRMENAVEAASRCVAEWPEWKRDAVRYR